MSSSPQPSPAGGATPLPSPPPGAAVHVVDDPIFDEHRARGHHPERPERLDAARRAVERATQAGLGALRLTPRDAADEEITRAHSARYLESLARLSGHYAALDADTYLAPASVAAARRAAGCAVALVEALLAAPASASAAASTSASASASSRAGIALLRPPGHHATRDTGMGFCLLNNVAIAAQAALAAGLSRVAVVDFDVHHGNGTQDIFWRDPRVLFCSLHQWPFYPGTGAADEVGEGEGAGYTVNIPLSDHADDPVYEAAFDEIVLPILDEYAPELILVSAGFDAHERDPLAAMQLTSAAYASMTAKLRRAAVKRAGGRLGLILEGGYNLGALEDAITVSLLAAAGAPVLPPEPPAASPARAPLASKHRGDLDRARHKALRRWTTL